MAYAQPPPTRDEVDAWFTAVLTGARTRDEADRWAAQWHGGPADDAVTDEAVWWALDLLHGIDLSTGPDGGFLHDDDQMRQWLDEFRRRCRVLPARDDA
ncbi:hypothetical protein [Micromonospora echinofusca]|uniref:DUF4880 domain-containing protein n=1 Tax=Micromonospora echinofusca TaxID=47858 RepID=A0ABS3VRM7_MICEH|nr:hypothetical protein [Micromonospora echinofusca]MBO4207189.1 hypothetical protein [Micromonospora echinofusca]